LTRPRGDLYLTIRNIDSGGVTLTLDTSPMIWLLWLGGGLAAAGGIWALSARSRERIETPTPAPVDV
jgi:cytochrome c-type biogenesis protein CcmF